MDYLALIHSIVDPFVDNKDAIMVRELPSNSEKDVTLLIVSENADTARLIGKKGAIANALREVIAVAGKIENKRIHLRFESYDEELDKD